MTHSEIMPGARVRLTRGAVLATTNPSRDGLVVGRPYWIKVQRVEDGRVHWIGRAAYSYSVSIADIDDVEDQGHA